MKTAVLIAGKRTIKAYALTEQASSLGNIVKSSHPDFEDIYMGTKSEKIAELINRRQRQILIHSIIYYKFNTNLISDSTWTRWAVELEELQKEHPRIAARQPYGAAYKGFDHSTGYNLPLDDPKANVVARRLVEYAKRKHLN